MLLWSCRTQPPDYILRNAKYTNKFFKLLTAAPHSDQSHTAYQILTAEEYEAVSLQFTMMIFETSVTLAPAV
jgi:hypothetical protein